MKKYFNASSLVYSITIIFFLFTSIAFASSPSLPHLMKQIAFDFSELEEAYREDEWDEAQEAMENICNNYTQLLPDLLEAAKVKNHRKKNHSVRSSD